MREIRVRYHWEPEGCWAESPDIDGFVVAGADIGEVRSLVREGVEFYLDGEQVDLLESRADGGPVSEVHLEVSTTYVAVSSVATALGRLAASTSTVPPVPGWRPAMSNEAASCPA